MTLHEKELRAVYTDTLIELMTENSKVVCLEADLGKSSGTVPRVWEAFPDRFFDVGVAEANMIGISAGLANEGMVPFCATFTPFATRRAYDQITSDFAVDDTDLGQRTRADTIEVTLTPIPESRVDVAVLEFEAQGYDFFSRHPAAMQQQGSPKPPFA